jgi:tetratricopeptide (TPR) repeat protein
LKIIYAVALFLLFSVPTLSQQTAVSTTSSWNDAERHYQELYSQKKYADATPYAQQALDLALNDPRASHADQINLLNNLAELYFLQREYSKAEQLARRALILRQGVAAEKADPLAIAVSQEDIAELLDRTRKHHHQAKRVGLF